jgi:hypothetical protein
MLVQSGLSMADMDADSDTLGTDMANGDRHCAHPSLRPSRPFNLLHELQ